LSHNLYNYGTIDPIYFKITLNGVGVNPTLATGDVILTNDGGATTEDIYDECTAIDGTNLVGIFEWQPTLAAQTQGEVVILNIKDVSAGGAFDENCLILSTGGNTSARFSG
jgi:hypothetical protein